MLSKTRVGVSKKAAAWGALLAVVVIAASAMAVYMAHMPGDAQRGTRPHLFSQEEKRLAEGLRGRVTMLADEIGERHAGRAKAYRRARDYLVKELEVITEGKENTRVTLENLGEAGHHADNVLLEILPVEAGRQDLPWFVLGAHYDTERGTPGANDNGSGVAVVLELAQVLASQRVALPVRVALFANEEQPFFGTAGMGSLVHARKARERGEDICAMYSLETLGYYSDEPNSQDYPWPINYFYPSTGNFVAFVGNLASRSLVRESISAFRQAVDFPSEGAALPERVPGVGWSDHSSFWQEGYRALMVTDTAVFRDPNYHRPTDVPEQLDYLRLARVTSGLEAAVRAVAASCAE